MNAASVPYNSAHSYYDSASAAAAGWHNTANSTGIPNMWDYYPHQPPTHHDYYAGAVAAHQYEQTLAHSTGTPSPHSLEGTAWHHQPTEPYYPTMDANGLYGFQPVKKRGTANKKERRRTVSINGAFGSLRDCIPNVPKDTKLSKIKTLRLATGYIGYLMEVLSNDGGAPIQEFKADLSRKTERRADKRKCIEAEIAAAAERKAKGRTGWPQTIWASDLKGEGPISKFQIKTDNGSNSSCDSHSFPQSSGSVSQSICNDMKSSASSSPCDNLVHNSSQSDSNLLSSVQ